MEKCYCLDHKDLPDQGWDIKWVCPDCNKKWICKFFDEVWDGEEEYIYFIWEEDEETEESDNDL